MINIEGLLGKVANNGATLLGILAHGEWNTLVQAVRELQQIVASDSRLANMQAAINQFSEEIESFSSTYSADLQNVNTAIDNNHLLYDVVRIAGVLDSATTTSGTVTQSVTWEDVYYVKNTNRFVCKRGDEYYTSWNGMFDWCADSSGVPYRTKAYLGDGEVYSYDTNAHELKLIGDARYQRLLTEINELTTNLGSLYEELQEYEAKQETSLTHAHFEGFISGVIHMEQISLDNYVAANSHVLYYRDLHKFILRYGVKYYSSWQNMADYNDANTGHPYTNKIYIYANQMYMYDFDNGILKPISIGLLGPMTAAEYEALGSDVNDDILYAIYEEE
jgi:hypothetical protein